VEVVELDVDVVDAAADVEPVDFTVVVVCSAVGVLELRVTRAVIATVAAATIKTIKTIIQPFSLVPDRSGSPTTVRG
jgi:hypothetical protein